MGLMGTLGGGGAGWVLSGGNPMGAAGGAYAGNWLEDKFSSAGGHDTYSPIVQPTVDYGGPTIDYAGNRSNTDLRELPMDYSMANSDRARSMAERGHQLDAYNMSMAAARGEGPSVAQQQMMAGQERAAQMGANVAAQARGGGGASLYAQQQAQQQAAMGAAAATRDAGILRAQEIAQARGEVGGLANSMRQAGQGDRQMSEARAIADAQARLANRKANDERSMGLLAAQQADRRAKAEYEAGNQDRALAAHNAAMGASQASDAANASRGERREAAILQAGATGYSGWQASKK